MGIDRKIKVLMLADYPYLEEDEYKGGIVQASMRLIQALSRLEQFELFVYSTTKHIHKREIKKFGNTEIHYFPFCYHELDVLLGYSLLIKNIKILIKEVSPHLIHAQGNPEYIYSTIRLPYPHLITIHGILRNELKVFKSKFNLRNIARKYFITALEKYYTSRINNLIAISPEVERFVKANSPDVNVYRIDNAIDVNFFEINNTNSSAVILFIGAVTYRKGLHILLEAYEKIVPIIPGIKIRIAGIWDWDPDYVTNLKNKYSKYIDSGQINFLGGISQAMLYKEMGQCSLLCLPSFAESAPMVISQALAAGKPVVATTVGGIPKMVNDGVTGILVPPNDPRMLGQVLSKLLLNKDMLLKMGTLCREEAVKRYHPDSVALNTFKSYCKILGKRLQ